MRSCPGVLGVRPCRGARLPAPASACSDSSTRSQPGVRGVRPLRCRRAPATARSGSSTGPRPGIPISALPTCHGLHTSSMEEGKRGSGLCAQAEAEPG
jgi:hypothetical protein